MLKLFAFAAINLLGAMSPGPDFAIVVRYGLTGSRSAATLCAAGVATALIIHVLYCIFGIVILIQKFKILFLTIHLGGAAYLAYLGIQLLRSASKSLSKPPPIKMHHQAFRDGLLTNLLNPKASLFLLSLFAQFITPETSLSQKIAFGILVPTVAFGWFSFLSMMLTHRRFLPHLQRYQKYFMCAMGIILLILATWVIVTASTY